MCTSCYLLVKASCPWLSHRKALSKLELWRRHIPDKGGTFRLGCGPQNKARSGAKLSWDRGNSAGMASPTVKALSDWRNGLWRACQPEGEPVIQWLPGLLETLDSGYWRKHDVCHSWEHCGQARWPHLRRDRQTRQAQ